MMTFKKICIVYLLLVIVSTEIPSISKEAKIRFVSLVEPTNTQIPNNNNNDNKHNIKSVMNETQHEQPLLFTSTDVTTFIIAAILIMLAAGGGIGGGGVLVPTYIFVLGFKPRFAIPLSNATILGGSVANILLNVHKRHPEADRPLIDWDIMLVMEPVTVFGALVGSFVNILCPPWLLCVLLVVLLSLTSLKSYKKGTKLYAKETACLKQNTVNDLKNDDRVLESWKTSFLPKNPEVDPRMAEALEQDNEQLATILKEESVTPLWKVAVMFIVTFGMLAITIFKGGNHVNPLHITCGSLNYWLVTLSAIPFVLLISVGARRYLVNRYHDKLNFNYTYAEGDVEWNEWNTIKYPIICSVAGLCAGMFGIGGGIVKGPLMLEMGVLPQVTSSTSATMIMFTASAATVSYLLFDTLNPQYGAFLCCLGFVFTLIGQKMLNAAVKKSGRGSLIVLLIATIVGLSAIAMGLQSSGSIVNLVQGTPEPAKTLC